MLVQHLLTERIFRKVFNNQEFLSRNVIAAEIEKVIRSITARHFSRDEFLKPLDRFYTAIEKAAESQTSYTEKQHFLNAVYEKFFQRFDTKQADTHGIVYTPQPIVDFMVRSVEEILQQEFGKSLSDSGVHILDPFTGTGNFITRIMQQIKRSALPQKYAEELHCNEIMLLPYYIASMNIEHAYMEKVGQYSPFEGICLVDTFDMRAQSSMFTEKNTERIAKQRTSPIFVVIGNPPYNAWQDNEDANNKNRKYGALDTRISETYARSSKAANKNALSDPYIKAFRWATDRIGAEGIVAFVTNNGFVESIAADGLRTHLVGDFDSIYVLDLGGNVRKNPKLSGTTHNVFGIQVGVSINFLIRKTSELSKRKSIVRYTSVQENWKRGQKYDYLADRQAIGQVHWQEIAPDAKGNWLNPDSGDYPQMGTATNELFLLHSNGVKTNRDVWMYSFSLESLTDKVSATIGFYNSEVDRWKRHGSEDVDAFVQYDASRISWSRDLKQDLVAGRKLEFDPTKVRTASYRPFCKMNLYFDPILNEEVYTLPKCLPRNGENKFLTLTGPGSEKPFMAVVTNCVPDLHIVGGGSTGQCLPFYICDPDGSNRRENISSITLQKFRTHYADDTITKWDIFHATYAVLHHPEYRTRYAANLKRELPRIPFPPDFHAFAAAGKRLMELHIDYEKQPEYPLEQIEDPTAEVSFRVDRMKLSKDKSELRYNDFLLLRGIPAAAYDYRLGNRSGLEWVIDQYRVSTDPRSGIVNDPNREDDHKYILRLIGQVITVSLETQQIIATLPSLNFPTAP